MGSKKYSYTDQNGKKIKVTTLQRKRISLCKRLSQNMGLNMVHTDNLRFFLTDCNGKKVGFKSSKSLNGLQKYLLTHRYEGGNMIPVKNEKKNREDTKRKNIEQENVERVRKEDS